jgi:hypothetical protein
LFLLQLQTQAKINDFHDSSLVVHIMQVKIIKYKPYAPWLQNVAPWPPHPDL